MWECSKCRENVEDSFEICWNCGTAQDGTEDPEFRVAEDTDSVHQEAVQPTANPVLCIRCSQQLRFVGAKLFNENSYPSGTFLAFLDDVFREHHHFDFYVCPRCGRVEFFVDGIGEEYRPN